MTSARQHETGWFTYASREWDATRGQTQYTDCALTVDLTFGMPGLAHQTLTFHDDARCRRGARMSFICQAGQQLMGWDEAGALVMDITLADKA